MTGSHRAAGNIVPTPPTCMKKPGGMLLFVDVFDQHGAENFRVLQLGFFCARRCPRVQYTLCLEFPMGLWE